MDPATLLIIVILLLLLFGGAGYGLGYVGVAPGGLIGLLVVVLLVIVIVRALRGETRL